MGPYPSDHAVDSMSFELCGVYTTARTNFSGRCLRFSAIVRFGFGGASGAGMAGEGWLGMEFRFSVEGVVAMVIQVVSRSESFKWRQRRTIRFGSTR